MNIELNRSFYTGLAMGVIVALLAFLIFEQLLPVPDKELNEFPTSSSLPQSIGLEVMKSEQRLNTGLRLLLERDAIEDKKTAAEVLTKVHNTNSDVLAVLSEAERSLRAHSTPESRQ